MKNYFIFSVLFISIVLLIHSCKSYKTISKFNLDVPSNNISYSFDTINQSIFFNKKYKYGDGLKNKAVSIFGENILTLETNINLTFPYGTSFWFKGTGNLITNKVKCTDNRSWAIEIEDHLLYLILGNTSNSKYEYIPIHHYLDVSDWNHLYINFESSDVIKIFCNGSLLSSLVLKAPLRKPNSTFLVGATHCAKTEGNFDNAFVGSIDEFAIYNKQLDVKNIKKIYYSQFGGSLEISKRISNNNEILLKTKENGMLEWEIKSIKKPISHFEIMSKGNIISSIPFNPYQSKYNFLNLSSQNNHTYKINAIGLDSNIVYSTTEITNVENNKKKNQLPRIEGFGISSPAGNNGLVYKVTNLHNTGYGSLRYGLEEIHEPRTIVFEISGVITLKSHIRILDPFVSVYGQTAPSTGIHITGGGLVIQTHDVLIQHLTIRPGDSNDSNINPLDSDAIAILGKPQASKQSKHTYNIIIDHCSLSWAIDENVSIWYNGVQDVTISNCIISEGLDNSLHPKGPHSKGLLVGPNSKNIAIIKNIFYNNVDRNPLVSGNCDVLILNNLIYACSTPIHIEDTGGNGHINAILKNNLISHSSKTKKKYNKSQVKTNLKENNNILILDDEIPISLIKTNDLENFSKDFTSFKLIDIIHNEDKLVQYLQTHAGAKPKTRNQTDKRIINDIKTGTIPNTLDCVSCEIRGKSLLDKELGQILKKKRTFNLPKDFQGNIANYIFDQNQKALKEK